MSDFSLPSRSFTLSILLLSFPDFLRFFLLRCLVSELSEEMETAKRPIDQGGSSSSSSTSINNNAEDNAKRPKLDSSSNQINKSDEAVEKTTTTTTPQHHQQHQKQRHLPTTSEEDIGMHVFVGKATRRFTGGIKERYRDLISFLIQIIWSYITTPFVTSLGGCSISCS